MKWIKTYETFTNDDNRGDEQQFPQHNQLLRLEAKKWVEAIKNSENRFYLFKITGLELPKEIQADELDKIFDEAEEKAIEYFVNHKEEIGQKVNFEASPIVIPGPKGYGIPIMNNIGQATHANSSRIGESIDNFDTEIQITDDEMELFNTKQPLIELIRNAKIGLGNKIVKFNKTDQKTLDTLDIYFEIDQSQIKAIDYYAKHGVPGEVNMETFPVNGGDGIPRTNNVGGTSHTASFRVGENKVNFDHEIEISDDEMRQFAKEEPLQDLIRSGKVRLTNKKVHFNKKDQETIDTLDMYLEIDKNLKSNNEDETHQENK